MAAAEIQIANSSNLSKIESFLNDPSYKEIIENSSTFNSRLCAERRMRMPFIDTQTGVAQSHCNLFMTRKQRMPGAREGQVYTYPAQRWRKARRQYLTMSSTRWGWSGADNLADNTGEGENSSGVPGDALAGDDSRDGSQTAKDDPKEWFYDELAMEELETGEDPDPESDEDYYDDTYANRRKRRGGATPTGPGSRGGRVRKAQTDDSTPKRGRAGRGRKRAAQHTLPYEVPGDAEKPFGCELCGAKYKTRPGLTYHFTHTHKDPPAGGTPAAVTAGSDGDSRDSRAGAHTPPQPLPPPATEYQDSYVTFLNNPGGSAAGLTPQTGVTQPLPRRPSPPPRPASADTSSSDSAHAPLVPPASSAGPSSGPSSGPSFGSGSGPVARPPLRTTPAAPPATVPPTAAPPATVPPAAADNAQPSPSPYCDFCLGDDRENKKTGTPEDLVSCSDCGRSVSNGLSTLSGGGINGPPPGLISDFSETNGSIEQSKLNSSAVFAAETGDRSSYTKPRKTRPYCYDIRCIGHPTCLQFTKNMIVSVRQYRWQCIECKCCSVCGTSDNDDQLLFCDDCDRGYHMYCLAPPLDTPPEGSWSCALCIREFHTPK